MQRVMGNIPSTPRWSQERTPASSCQTWLCLLASPAPTLGPSWEQPQARKPCCKLQAVLLLCNYHMIDSPSCGALMRRSSAMAGTTALPLQQAQMILTACRLPVSNLMSRPAHSRASQSRHVRVHLDLKQSWCCTRDLGCCRLKASHSAGVSCSSKLRKKLRTLRSGARGSRPMHLW